MQKRHRTFIAINLPPEVRKYLAGFSKKWPELSEEKSDGEFTIPAIAKWTNPENLHVTLIFLGELTELELGQVCLLTSQVAKNHQMFEVRLSKVALGPAEKTPRYIWAGGEVDKSVQDLKNDLEDALLEAVHFVPEKRAFSPHVTLARLNSMAWRAQNPEEAPTINEDIDLVFTVESIEVMESELKKGGPVYTVIESYPLA